MRGPTLMVLAAGMGSRYGGLKQVDPVGPGGEIVLDYSIYDALRAGFEGVTFVIRRDIEEAFRAAVSRKWEGRTECRYAFQELADLPEGYAVPEGRAKPWGTAHAIRAGRRAVDGPFAAINADDFYGRDSFRVLAEALRRERGAGEHCMVAFRLDQTLSENGSVSRGVCLRDAAGRLAGIREHTKIARAADGRLVDTGSGTEEAMGGGELVSMNCWGFMPGIFDELERGFGAFLDGEARTNPKAEYTIPAVVDAAIRSGRGSVEILETRSQWFGVTYREDKPGVVESIRRLTEAGEYPSPL